MSEFPVESAPSIASAQTVAPGQPIDLYKPRCNPCPCTTLQCGVQAIAIFIIVFFCIMLIPCFNWLYSGQRDGEDLVMQDHSTKFAGVISYTLIFALLDILAIVLCRGAIHLSHWRCSVYFIGTSLLLLAAIAQWMVNLSSYDYHDFVKDALTELIFMVVFIIILVYSLIIVYFFMQELKLNAARPDQQFDPVVRPLPYRASQASLAFLDKL